MFNFFRHKLESIRRNDDGATAVEMAFLGPIIILIIFAAIETGIFFMGTHQAQQAADETSRRARMENLQSKEAVLNVLKEEMGTPIGGKFSPTVTLVSAHGENFADIKVQYDYTLHLPFADAFPFSTTAGTRVLLRDSFS